MDNLFRKAKIKKSGSLLVEAMGSEGSKGLWSCFELRLAQKARAELPLQTLERTHTGGFELPFPCPVITGFNPSALSSCPGWLRVSKEGCVWS